MAEQANNLHRLLHVFAHIRTIGYGLFKPLYITLMYANKVTRARLTTPGPPNEYILGVHRTECC